MKIRDQLANDITSAIQSYIRRYSKYDEISEDRKRDIQAIWLILKEINPVKLRKRLAQKLEEMPNGFILFFMFDLKKLKLPLLEVIQQQKYQKANLKLCYEKELSLNGDYLNKENILHLVERVNQLETNAAKSEQRTKNLELEVARLTKENSFLSLKLQELYERNKQLEKEKNDALKQFKNAESKLLTMEDKYLKLLDENKQLKAKLNLIPKTHCRQKDAFELAKTTLSPYA